MFPVPRRVFKQRALLAERTMHSIKTTSEEIFRKMELFEASLRWLLNFGGCSVTKSIELEGEDKKVNTVQAHQRMIKLKESLAKYGLN